MSSDLTDDALYQTGPVLIAPPRPVTARHLVICGRGCWRRVDNPADPTPKRCPRHKRPFRAPGPDEPAPCDACLQGQPQRHTGIGCYRCDCGCHDHGFGIGASAGDLARPKRSKRGRARR